MMGCLPEGITPIYEADGVEFRETIGSLCILCFMIQSRSTSPKDGRKSEHPSPTVGLLTQKARLHTELWTDQLALFCLQNPQPCFLVIALLEAIKYLCVIWRLQLPKFSGGGWSGDEEAGSNPLCPGRFVPINSLKAEHWSQCLLNYSRSWVPLVCLSENQFLSLRTTMFYCKRTEPCKKKHWELFWTSMYFLPGYMMGILGVNE